MKTLREKIQTIISNGPTADGKSLVDSILSLIQQEIKECENFYEYTPREDMFGVGYERAIDDMLKRLK